MKQVMTYIGYIMGILGFAGIVWTYAQKSAAKDYDVKDLKDEITEIKENMVTVDGFRILSDSLSFHNKRIEYKVGGISVQVMKLSNQFTKHLSKDSSVTKEELREIINELNEKKN